MWTTTFVFILIDMLKYAQGLKEVTDFNWTTDPAEAWPPLLGHFTYGLFDHRVQLVALNIPNFSNNGVEKKFIAPGVLLDNSRILTSYNPFRRLIRSSNITDNILVMLVVGYEPTDNYKAKIKIVGVVCGRQIIHLPDDENTQWHGMDPIHSPLHDLMVLRTDKEIGIATSSKKFVGFNDRKNDRNVRYYGQCSCPTTCYCNTLLMWLAGPDDQLDGDIRITSLGNRDIDEMREYDKLRVTIYKAEDNVLVDCEEWMPRTWGYFICIRNIDDFPGIGSGATLVSDNKLFGVGSFAMFRKHESILVFTDVRPYNDLIMQTCGDDEFT